MRARDAAVEDRPAIGDGGRPRRARGAERRGRLLGSRHVNRRSRLGGPCVLLKDRFLAIIGRVIPATNIKRGVAVKQRIRERLYHPAS